MNKSEIRKNLLKIRKKKGLQSIKINFGHIVKILKKNKIKSKIIGGYYPYNFEIDASNILNQLSEYTETFGISMPTKSNYYIPDIIDSYSLKNEIVNQEWNSKKFTNKKNLIDYWEIKDHSLLEQVITYLKLKFNNNFFNKDLS